MMEKQVKLRQLQSAPPLKTHVWDLWKVEGSRKARQNLPSEQKLSQDGYQVDSRNDKEKGEEQPKEDTTTI
ncbi:unnamed protein product [Musa hybrid cultivar]